MGYTPHIKLELQLQNLQVSDHTCSVNVAFKSAKKKIILLVRGWGYMFSCSKY